jgi:hypothetical protein
MYNNYVFQLPTYENNEPLVLAILTSRWKIGCMDVRSRPMTVREKEASPSIKDSMV